MIEKKRENVVMSIQNNFLPKEQFDTLRDTITTSMFPWYFNNIKVAMGEDQLTSPSQFTHMIYMDSVPCSRFYNDLFFPIINQMECVILQRIKMNLSPRLPEPFYSDFHIDPDNLTENITAHLTTAILYIGTNNGYTEFEDGTKVESVANRLVTFPTNTRHRGVTQTDEQTRIVINFNYLK